MKNNNKFVVLDLIFYVAFPLAIWHIMRDMIGDYYAMLLSSVPGIFYTIYRFKELKKVNVFGIFMISNLIVGTLVDVLSGSAIRLLWNNVYYSYAVALLFLLTIPFKKPISLYFALDFTELQGYDRSTNKKLFFHKRLFPIFNWIVVAFALQNIILASIKAWLISQYGVEAFDKGIVLRQLLNWGLTIPVMAGYLYIGKIIYDNPDFVKEATGSQEEDAMLTNERL
ncbi:VC0807 family protein [Pontibacillus salicampi]|uniref:VC0807 family protein n=1 Tax=Pontibacillus salicampi TaxID=1449801 RepID=A0ABV6LUR9_9BACI